MENIKNNVVEAWLQVHSLLEKALPGHAIHAWFDPIAPVGFRENSFFLEVPNQFFLEWIDSHYKDDIIKAIKRHMVKKLNINFLYQRKNFRKLEIVALKIVLFKTNQKDLIV